MMLNNNSIFLRFYSTLGPFIIFMIIPLLPVPEFYDGCEPCEIIPKRIYTQKYLPHLSQPAFLENDTIFLFFQSRLTKALFSAFPVYMDTLNQNLSAVISRCTPLPSLLPSEKDYPPPIGLAKKRIYMESHLKEEFIDLIWKLPFPFPNRQNKRGWWTLC